MKNLFLNLIFLSILLPFFAFAQTTYRPSDFLYNIGSVKEVVQGPATTDGQRQTTTIYESGARMDIIPNSPNPPLIKWTLPDGSRYQTQPGSTDIYVQLTPPNIQSPATNTQPTTRLPELGQENILNSIVPPSTFDNGQSRGLSGILNQLFYAGLIIAVVLAIVMIIRGGIEYMTIDAASNKESAKNRIKAAIGGLVLCFSTILILNTINPGLTKLELRFPKLENLETVTIKEGVVLEEGNPLVNIPTQVNENTSTSTPIEQVLPSGKTEKELRDYLAQYGIYVNKPACQPGQTSCTNLAGIKESAITGVVNLKNASGAAKITITGGTEPGHKTHGIGKPILDLRIGEDSRRDTYIRTQAVSTERTSLGPIYIHSNGNRFLDENPSNGTRHWHVVFR
jgi:hypothetical protein